MTVQWRKSSHSGGINDSACVEIAGLASEMWIRDSKDPDGDRLAVTGETFKTLVRRIKEGAHDIP
ncbi:DUF397 domain-containing protein [Actinomadura viridis]|uniref:DUF397 domain-containing protein n=1 Tax=Actinomadura viridis TaxID=58110 RepID=A0A931DM02_9ACTN|nr:DUF397 domain-containing protein [Actinomadura viridis]MBG6089535.1 hypothetical protein [Actinomadura viridis]